MSDIASQHKYPWPDAHEAATESHKDRKDVEIMARIAKSVTGFFTVIVHGIIEGRQRQAEYIAKHHHWY